MTEDEERQREALALAWDQGYLARCDSTYERPILNPYRRNGRPLMPTSPRTARLGRARVNSRRGVTA